MTTSNSTSRLGRRDGLIALCVGLFGLAVYTLALAPDILYSDSGEFQTLAYTLGTTHPTGYPIYLLLARIIGFIPIESPAWRINFFSAVAAAVTLGALYLLARFFMRRLAAVLSSLVLLVSYTFWSQSIITEVYAPGVMFITLALLILLLWQENPVKRRWLLFTSGLLIGLGLGVHLFVTLLAPAMLLFVAWGMIRGTDEERTHRWRHLGLFVGGGVTGAAVFVLLFFFIDSRPTPTSTFATIYFPSRDAWDMEASDLDSSLERFQMNITGKQWQGAMLPPGVDYGEVLSDFWNETLPREYTIPALLLAALGVIAAVIYQRRKFALLAVGLVTTFGVALVYFPGDKYIFYLPSYLIAAVFIGLGADSLSKDVEYFLPSGRLKRAVPFVVIPVLLVICIAPFLPSRWKALGTERSGFVTEDYAYPRRLTEPREIAECVLAQIPESDVLLVTSWRELYGIYYVAHVEQGRTGIIIQEAVPFGADGITPDHQEEIAEAVRDGRAVYVDMNYPALRSDYIISSAGSPCSYYRLQKLSPRP